ncbi:hypothetical protein AB2L37_00565 [Staphylococcus pseudintermedius]|uniref:hypothetical protein n=1 Tax=Staphylococcus pseudintermedius TaxID=283734 RepID=UPI003F9C8312
MKQVMTGRGTGKSNETVCMLVRDENLWCIIPNQYRGLPKKNVYEPLCKNLPEKVRESVLSRIVTYDEFVEDFHFRRISRIPRDAKFHVEEADMVLRDFLKINFDTMTTSHWSVQKFEE